MPTVVHNVTNSVTITITVNSVANNALATSSAINNATDKYVSANVQVKITTASAATSATGYVNVYMVRSSDGGTTYDTTGALIGSIPAIANSTVYTGTFSTEPYGVLGTTWKVIVENKTGATLAASGNAVLLAGVKFDIS